MNADEIRRLTDLSTPVMPEHWQATVMWPEQWDKIKAALLAYAAMVERCEKMIRPCRLEDAPCVPSDAGYCDSCDIPTHNEPFNYILHGDAGKEERK